MPLELLHQLRPLVATALGVDEHQQRLRVLRRDRLDRKTATDMMKGVLRALLRLARRQEARLRGAAHRSMTMSPLSMSSYRTTGTTTKVQLRLGGACQQSLCKRVGRRVIAGGGA